MPLTKDRNTPWRGRGIESVPVPVAAGAVIYSGSLVAANASGYAQPGSSSNTLTYLGRANERVENSGGNDGDKTVLVSSNTGFLWANSATDPVTEASLGKLCYIEDDETVSATNGSGAQSACGIVSGFESGGVWVHNT